MNHNRGVQFAYAKLARLINMQKVLKRVLLFIVISMTACTTQYDALLIGFDIDAKYNAAFELFEKKSYLKAANLFESLSLSTKGTPQEDTVQFYWALSNFNYGDYQTAGGNFQEFLEVFPRSPFTQEARFRWLQCLYKATYRYELDQIPTHRALMAIEESMYEDPNSPYMEQIKAMQVDLEERLDKKAYEAAKLYYHIEDYPAAHYALKNVLRDDSENIYRKDVLYYTALSSYQYAINSVEEKKKERFLTFVDDYYNYVAEYPESKEVKELDGLYKRAQKELDRLNRN